MDGRREVALPFNKDNFQQNVNLTERVVIRKMAVPVPASPADRAYRKARTLLSLFSAFALL